jgi:peroxiredoxin
MNKWSLILWRWSWKWRAWRAQGLQAGGVFPDFALKDIHGCSHTLSGTGSNQYALLWFTNLCEDCRAKIPLLNELHHEARDRFRILAVSILDKDDPLPYEISKSCDFPILIDPQDGVGKRLGLAHPPGTCPLHNLFLLDHRGRIIFRHHLSALEPDAFRKVWNNLAGNES